MTPQESILPVNNAYEPGRAEMAGRPELSGAPQRAQNENTAPAAKDKPAGEKTAAHGANASSAVNGSPWNIRMRFEVEPETKRVTVLIIDKQSQKVIRTIPADQLEKMQQGDLLELYI